MGQLTGVNNVGFVWVKGMPGLGVDLGCERFLRSYMKVRELTVVTVVRGGKVDIGDEIATDAPWRIVRALENLSRGNVGLGIRVQ